MRIFALIGGCLLLAGNLFAQQIPHLAYVYPAGGQIGTTFQVVLGGRLLLAATNAFVTGPGITATVLDSERPMNFQEYNKLRDRFRELQGKFQDTRKGNAGTNVWTEVDAAEREQLRAKLLKNPPNRTANQAMVDKVTVRIAIATNCAPGESEIRLGTPNALSNPLKFCVGALPEVTNVSAKAANPEVEKFLETLGARPVPPGTPKYEAPVNLPATVNGQIMPGGVDRYRFSATRGQQLIIAVNARSLNPYLADAVPGWFEANLILLDAQGGEVASAERYHFQPDPVLHFTLPHDGSYTVQVHDSLYRGREDFVYRLTIGELPFVTGIFPLGGPVGQKTTIALTGWNLPARQMTVDNSAAEPGVITLPENFLHPVPFAVDRLPEISARGDNHTRETAQAVTLPVIINGRVGQPNEAEVFQFVGKAGQPIVAEISARRLDSPLDSFLRLTDARGAPLAFNDDFEDKGTGLNTFHADSYLTNTLPADGTYFLHLRDTQSQGGPDFAYRLRISEPQPDFALRVVPSSLSLRAGMSAPVTVFALRRDGFTNAIDLRLKDTPAGFSLSGAKIPAGQDKAQFTLKAPAQPTEKPFALALEGRALIGGKLVTHAAVPSEDLMQAFFYRHLVPSQELAVMVNGQPRPALRDSFKLISATPVKIAPGSTARVRLTAPPGNDFNERFKLELESAPEGMTLEKVARVGSDLELTFACDPDKTKPGMSGNLICAVIPLNPAAPDPQKKRPANQPKRPGATTLPAIPFLVVDPP